MAQSLRRFRAMQQGVLAHLGEIERKAEVHLGRLAAIPGRFVAGTRAFMWEDRDA